MSTEKLSELSKPVAHVVRCSGGEVASIKMCGYAAPNGFTSEPLYSQEYVSALQHESAVNWEAAASLNVENQELKKRIAELEAKLATPVRLPKRWDVTGQVNPPRIVEVQFEQQNRTHDQCVEAIRAAGFTVEGDE